MQLENRGRHFPLERPAAFFVLTLAAGLISADHFPGLLNAVLAGTAAAGILVALWFSGALRRLVLSAMAFFALGYGSLQPWVAPLRSPDHIVYAAGGPPGIITGQVASLPTRVGARTRFVLAVKTIDQRKASGKLRVTAVGRVPEFQHGDRLLFRARLKSIRNFNNPGAFDYRRYLAYKQVWASAWVPGREVQVLASGPADYRATLARVRASLSNWITATVGNRQGRILDALVTGNRSGISPELRRQFNRLGIGHLLAISGLHVGIIATVSFWVFHLLGRWLSWGLEDGRVRPAAALATLLPVTAYGLIAGMSPSTQRAVIMVAVYLFTILLDREQDPLNTLAAAALIIIVIHPPALFSISFQLSFGAVFSILYGMRCLPARWRQPLGPPVRPWGLKRVAANLAAFFWASFFAIAGTLPLSMHYFNQVSYVGILTNFIYIPVVGFVTVPLALLAAMLFPVSIPIADAVLKAAAVPLSGVMDLADRLYKLEWIAGQTVTPTWLEMLCFFSLWVLVLQLIKASGRIQGRERGPNAAVRPQSIRKVTWKWLLPIALLLVLDTAYWMHHRFWHRDLRVTCLDVRQGSAALLEFPGGKTMLIDGGGYADNSVFDMGARVVAPYLWRQKIKTVDTLVLTHPNSDHMGGLLYIAENFNVKEIWTNAETAPTKGYSQLMRIIKARGISHPDYRVLPRISSQGGVTVTVLYPPRDFLTRRETDSWRNSNNNSIVLKAEFEGVAFLFAGDIMQPAERELAGMAGEKLQSTVLFVPHHGSRSSSSALFLHRVAPVQAVISVGWRNRYRFPHKSVLARYRAAGSRVYRTDKQGAIIFRTRGGRLRIQTTRPSADPSAGISIDRG